MLLAALDHASRGGANGGPRILFPLFFLLLIGFLVGGVIKRRRGRGHHNRHGSSLATLRDRFARGEIDRAEYDHRLAVLNGDDMIPPAPPAPKQPAYDSEDASDAGDDPVLDTEEDE